MLSFPIILAELDIEIIILDDKGYNETKFIEAVSEFNPVIIVNNTEIPLLFGRPQVRNTGFTNPVLCVNGSCYKEADLPPPAKPIGTPVPAEGGSNIELIVIAVTASVVTLALLGGMCWCLVKQKPSPKRNASSTASRFHRVVIRESIDFPPHLASPVIIVKMGSKHTRGMV
jgi:hypothetical protein